MLRKISCKLFFIMTSFFMTGMVDIIYAMDIVPSSSGYYYRMGGGSDISLPPVTEQQDIRIGGDINSNLGFSCDGFNPAVSIANTFNNMKDSIQGIKQGIIGSATGAVASLPMYLLEKASPEIYNLLENTINAAQDNFHLSMKSCQDALGQIKNNKSPYQDWFSVSDSQGWLNYAKAAKQGQAIDINNAKKELTKHPKEQGIPWVHKGQNSGGTKGNQMPINVIYDVVVAGYNKLLDSNRALDDKTPAPSNSDLAHYWKTSDSAGKWARLVLGDITISAKADQPTHAGIGLVTLMRTCPNLANNDLTCVKSIKLKLTQLIKSNSMPTGDELQKVSSRELLITPAVITAIRNTSLQNQAIAISKLSEDVAIQNTIDEALLLRRILIAGSQTQPVHNLKPALNTVRQTIQHLDQDIKNVLFEHQIKQQLVAPTLKTILSDERLRRQQASIIRDKTQAPVMENGATYHNKGDNAL